MTIADDADLDHLRTRYGTRPTGWGVWLAIVIVAVPFVTWVVWAGVVQGDQELRWSTTSFRDATDTSVVVDFDVFAQAGSDVTCTVRALDDRGVEVGRAQVPVRADESSENVVYALAVTARPSSAFVESCRPAD
jgi:hypothetical protein